MARSTTIRIIGGILVGTGGATLIPFGLEEGNRITPFQADLIVIVGIVAVVIGSVLWLISFRFKRIENDKLIQNIPTLLADMDIRRGEIIQSELGKRMSSDDTLFVFSVLQDIWLILVGDKYPELPAKIGGEDIASILGSITKYSYEAKSGIGRIQEQTAKLGEKETGLLVARKVDKHFPIDDKVEKDRGYRRLKKKLKIAREHLPSAVACDATIAIDNYIDFSKAYRAFDILVVSLSKMLDENDLLRGVPIVARIIDIFQRYREQYVKLMNGNLAKVNKALGKL